MARRGFEGGGASFEYGGPMGKLVENNMLGSTRRDMEMNNPDEYQRYDDAMNFVRENQKGDPTDPSAWFANDLHATVAEKIGLKDYSRLKFYTAVGSKLDQFHGIDAVIELQLDEEDPTAVAQVTLDLTMNPNKTDYKADVIIQVPQGGIDRADTGEYPEFLQLNADEIAGMLKIHMPRG